MNFQVYRLVISQRSSLYARSFHSSAIKRSSSSGHNTKFTLKKKAISGSNEKVAKPETESKQPTTPVRARFAPSPTGFLHLGSLRTALYNYLIAKSTSGQFLLRLEDTDQKRLVQGAEKNIYDTLKWLGVKIDEGPEEGGPHAPYRQSERSEIYADYATEMLNNGSAYRCFCSKERLDGLRDSARLLKPPTTVSYDRHCLNHHTKEESDLKAANGEEYTIRFKSPERYPVFTDLLHGTINHQPQVNPFDKRYDDPILVKSDKLPTYHFANVIDDHLMKITHVVRGEEWLASTAKHIAMYDAFGWSKPDFIHIPLLTTTEDKKLSKRSGDIDILSLKSKGYLAEALINFSSLFGWSPKREHGEKMKEFFSLKDLEKNFNIDGLTIGNAKVDFKKLDYFNKYYLSEKLKSDKTFFDESLIKIKDLINSKYENLNLSNEYLNKILTNFGPTLVKLNDIQNKEFEYLFITPNNYKEPLDLFLGKNVKKIENISDIVKSVLTDVRNVDNEVLLNNLDQALNEITQNTADKYSIENLPKRIIFQTVRLAVSAGNPGVSLPIMIDMLGVDELKLRVDLLLKELD